MENSDLMARINNSYKSFSKGQKSLANYILDNYDRAAFITASKMGRIVGVSESTVVRFAYALGYDGYPELQKSLQELIRNKLTSVQRIQLTSDMNPNDVLKSVLKADMANIRSTVDIVDNETFNNVIEQMLNAHKIYIIAFRSASPIAQFLSYYLNFVMDNIVTINPIMGDAREQMIHVTEEDICIGISFPRYSRRTLDALSFAKNKKAKIIAITDSITSPIAELADFALTARSDMASFADSLVAPLSLINAIIVAITLSSKEDIYDRFTQLEKLWIIEKEYLTKDNN